MYGILKELGYFLLKVIVLLGVLALIAIRWLDHANPLLHLPR